VKFSCEKCGRSYVADEKVRGRAFKMKCKQCGNVIVVKPTPAPDSLGGPGLISLPDPVELTAPVLPQLEQEAQLPTADPFAFEVPPGPDPFALPPDPFAAPPPDPFARASHDPVLEHAPADDPSADAAAHALTPGFALFPEAPPAARAVDATGRGGARLSEVEALFADLAEEMKQPALAGTPHAAAPARSQAEPTPPALTAGPVEPVPAGGAGSAPARTSRRGVVLAGAVALAAVAGGAGWLLLHSDGASPAAANAAPGAGIASPPSAPKPATAAPAGAPVAPARGERSAPGPGAAPPAALPHPEGLPEAALADLERRPEPSSRKAAASPRERDRKRAEATPAVKPAAKPAPKVASVKAPPPAPAVQPQPAPEPAKSELTMDQVEVRRRSAAPQPTPTAALHAAPAAPPLTSNSDLPPLDDKMIEATVARYESSFDGCVAASRQSEPGLAISGRKVVVTMTVNPNGRALYPTLDDVELGATDLGRCLKRESAKMVFPAFSGEPIRARVPLTLR